MVKLSEESQYPPHLRFCLFVNICFSRPYVSGFFLAPFVGPALFIVLPTACGLRLCFIPASKSKLNSNSKKRIKIPLIPSYLCRLMHHCLQQDFFITIGQLADELGLETYVVGGFVRDCLLGREVKDVDFVVIGNGIDLAEAVSKKIPGTTPVYVYQNYGTAGLKTADGWDLEFVGARKESYNRNSRKPQVENGSLVDDQNRRDFSINAMAISLNKERFGLLIDPFNGQADLEAKEIRTPLDPDITFSDDPLRMMRAIRFATQLSFCIVPETLEGIKRNAERISIVSIERISDELNKIVMAKKPSIGFKLLFDTGLLPLIFPEFCALQGVETKNGLSHKDNFYHTLQVLDNVAEESNNLWLRWSAILHDIAKPATKRFEEGHGWTFHGHEDKGARMVKGIFRKLRLPLGDNLK